MGIDLKRAVAEFVVIVVGVLVALGVDSWASEREDRADEIQYLEQLAEELARDVNILIDGLIPGVERGTAAIERVDAVASGASPFPSDTMALLLDVLTARGSQAVRLGTRTTFDELLSTGSLRLIESASLRSAITGYYGGKDLAERRIEAARSGYSGVVSLHLPTAPSRAAGGPVSDGLQRDLLRAHGFERAAQVIAGSELHDTLTEQQNFLRVALPILQSVLADAEGLTTAVEAELRELR